MESRRGYEKSRWWHSCFHLMDRLREMQCAKWVRWQRNQNLSFYHFDSAVECFYYFFFTFTKLLKYAFEYDVVLALTSQVQRRELGQGGKSTNPYSSEERRESGVHRNNNRFIRRKKLTIAKIVIGLPPSLGPSSQTINFGNIFCRFWVKSGKMPF